MMRGATGFLLGLALCLSGCAQYKTATVGYSTGQPVLEATLAKHWYNGSLKPPYGDTLPWYGDLCRPNMEARCDANGDWSVTNEISNGSVPHAWSMRVDFGHQENDDPRTFVVYASFLVPPQHFVANEMKTLKAAGAADENIRAHFQEINAVRPVFVEEDTATGLSLEGGILWISKGN